MTRILVGLDGSRESAAALEAARALAGIGDTVELFTVLEEPKETGYQTHGEVVWQYPGMAPSAASSVTLSETKAQAVERVQAEAKERLESLAGGLRAIGLDASVNVAFGDPVKEILDEARETGADVVVVGSHGRSGLRDVLIGSVPERLLRSRAAPILVAPPQP